MKGLKTLVAAAGLVLAAACSDTSNQMTGIDPNYAKAGRGGYGDPHFTTDMVCTFNNLTGRLACDYQIAGLSSNSTGLGSLQANVIVDYFCDYDGDSKDQYREKVSWQKELIWYSDEGGNAKGHVEDTPSLPTCRYYYGYTTPAPSEVEYSLDQYASAALLPYLQGGAWSLNAVVARPKGLPRFTYFSGAWVPEPIQ